MHRLAVFDVDGTLVDSQHNIVASMAEACVSRGHGDPGAAAIRRIIGLSLVEAVATLLPGAPAGEHLAVAHAYKEVFVRLRRQPNYHEPLFPGAREALAALAGDGWLLGIATGKSRRGLVQVIEHHGLGGLFVTTQTADDHPGKPDPAMLRRAMADCGVEPAAAVMIGDTTYDMAMARAASVAAIGVGWGCHPLAELEDAGAVAVVDDFGLLPPLLAGLIRSGAGPRRDRAREDRQCV